MSLYRLLPICALTLILGCKPMPAYRTPAATTPTEWKEASPQAGEELSVCEEWWSIFQDPFLDDLESRALRNSPTLEAAVWQAVEARALARVASSPLYPSVAFAPTTLNQLSLSNNGGYSPHGDPFLERVKTTQYTLPIDVFYEFDLWGHLRYGADAGFANAQAKQAAWHAARLSLTASVAEAYFTVRSLDATTLVLQDAIIVRTHAYEIALSRFEAGLANYEDVARAQTELATAQAELSETLRLRALEEHLLAVLVGEVPSCFCQATFPLQGTPPHIQPLLPCEVLLRRPDVAEADRRIATLYAEEGVAYTSLFPSIAITTQLGLASPQLSNLWDWKARLWTVAWEGFQTIYDGGRKCADIAAAKARVQQAVSQYSNTVLVSFQEVEDALASLYWQQRQLEEWDAAIAAAAVATELAVERYEKGLVTYLDVVDARRTLLNAQLNATRASGNRFLATVQLAKALGGGWQPE